MSIHLGMGGSGGGPTTRERQPTGDAARGDSPVSRGFVPTLLLYTVQSLALLIVVVARRYGVVANEPLWAYGVAIMGSSIVSKPLDRWVDLEPGSWRLHARIGLHAFTVMAVIYLTGWGPALGMCFVYCALVDLSQSGAQAWRVVLGWSLLACGLGQLSVLSGVMPSFLSNAPAQALGFIGAFAFAIVIRMAGAIGKSKEDAETALARAIDDAQRSEAHHRSVVENAAEGILTVALDGSISTFNSAAEAMFGWDASDVVGRPITTIFPNELHVPIVEFLAVSETDGRTAAQRKDVEVTGVRRDGSQFPMIVSTSAVMIEGAEPVISGIVRDLSDQKHLEAQLAHQALHDPLTGLPNRLMLTDRLDQALGRVRRRGQICGVLYADLDRFKSVNDTLGHACGDQLLVHAAERIQAAVRETDTVARLGGDEFVVLCEEIDAVHDATELAGRIIAQFEDPFRLGDGDDTHVSTSIGIALSGDGDETAESILANADIAMYRAKANGRSCYELFDEAMQQWVTTQTALESALRQAVPRNELRLYCQPVVASDSGVVCGLEALVRWERPGCGLVMPDQFIPTAEETGLIVDLGAWVLEQACDHAAGWARRWPDRTIDIAVNVSSRQLLSGDFVGTVTGALERSGLDASLLTLELTESTLIDDAVSVEPLLRELRRLGVNLALDDFGTGYSSLTYLRAFPINIVKIDKSFVRALGTEREDTAIVAAVIGLAKNLGLRVIAEGIERPEQLAVLHQLACPNMQGYLFSRPIPIHEAPRLLRAPTLGLAPAREAAAD